MQKKTLPAGILVLALCLLVPLIYSQLHLRYRLDNVDDAWSFSLAYQWRVEGVMEDVVFRGGGEAGAANFGLLYRVLYGWVGSTFGWTKSNAHLTSTALVAGAALLWGLALRKLGYGPVFCLLFGLLFLLVEPLFGAANQARIDALALFWTAAAVLMASRGSGPGVGLFTVLAFESHPVGAVHAGGFGLAILVYTILVRPGGRNRAGDLKKALLGCLAGAAAGVVIYLALYGEAAGGLVNVLSGARRMEGYSVSNYFFSYFFRTRYLRHLPELLLLLLVAVAGFRSGFFRRARLEAILAGAALLASVIIARPNFFYVAFAYPAFLLLFLSFGAHFKKTGLMAAGLAVFFALQYSWVYRQHRDYVFSEQVERLRSAVADDNLPVIGTANAWFAFYDREFRHISVPRRGLPDTGRGFYLVRSTDDRYRPVRALDRLIEDYTLTRLDEFKGNGGRLTVDKALPPGG